MLRSEIVGVVRSAMSEVMEQVEERWVTPKELSQQFAFFTKEWLRHYGHMLPRERVVITLNYDHMKDNGEIKKCTTHSTPFAYPLHKINRMVAEGKFREMEYKEVMKTRRKSDKEQKGKDADEGNSEHGGENAMHQP